MKLLRKYVSALIAGLAMAGIAHAQQAGSAEPIDTVHAFNQICYKQVPDIRAITEMAVELGWKPLSVTDLQAFGDKETLSVLQGWDVQVGEKFYRLGLIQGPLTASMKETFPEFAAGTSTSCTFVLDGSDANAAIAVNMQSLANKEPVTTGMDEGDLSTTTWAGGNDDFKVFLFNKQSKLGDGGILSVTVISKK